MKKTILSVFIGLTLLGSTSMAMAGEPQKFDPYTQGAVSKADPYTDGAKMGKFDPYTDGAKAGKFDVYTDGLKSSKSDLTLSWREDVTYPADFSKIS